MGAGRAQRWRRTVLSVFIVFHLMAMGASLCKKTAAGQTLRQVTGPYERLLGIWQSWGMFGPNPPNGSSYLVATGVQASGEEVDAPVLVGEVELGSFKWFYSRSLKLERSASVRNKNRRLREGYGQWICREAASDGVSLERVQIWKRRVLHLDPAERRSAEASTPMVQRVDLQTVRCEASLQ